MPACPMALPGQDSVGDNRTWLHFIQAVHDVGMPSAFHKHCALTWVQTKEFRHIY